jgi:hypothetical protein
VTARFGIVTAEFGIVTGRFGDVTERAEHELAQLVAIAPMDELDALGRRA